jgi:hypothetical protein
LCIYFGPTTCIADLLHVFQAYYSFYKFSFQLGEKHFRYGANPRLMGLLGLAFATVSTVVLTDIQYVD